jgi:hypothetical protein
MMIRMSGSRLAKHWHVHVVQVYRYSHVEIVSTRKREGGPIWVHEFINVLPLKYDTFGKRKNVVLSRCRLLVNMTNGLKMSYY